MHVTPLTSHTILTAKWRYVSVWGMHKVGEPFGCAKLIVVVVQCVSCLSHHCKAVLSVDELMERFRANLVISGDVPPFVEDTWTEVSIGDFHFEVHSLHPCVRVRVRVRVRVCAHMVQSMACNPPTRCNQTSHHTQ